MPDIVSVHVKPKSRKSCVLGYDRENILRVEVRAAAHDGRANLELVKLLSKHFGRQVRIKSGLGSKNKTVELV